MSGLMDLAITDMCIYCSNHTCSQDDYIKRCRIKNVIGCDELYAKAPYDWDLGKIILAEGLDSDTIDELNHIENYCSHTKCAYCGIRERLKCQTRELGIIAKPKNFNNSFLFDPPAPRRH